MSEQLTQFIHKAESDSFDTPWVTEFKAKAWDEFLHLGIPIKTDEDWKYTNTNLFLKHDFKLSTHTAHVVIEHLPPGVLVVPLKEAFLRHEDKIKPYLGQIMQSTHGFHALNNALFQEGFLIFVPEGIQVDEPLILRHTEPTVDEMRAIRHVVVAEKDSKLNLLEAYTQTMDKAYFTSVITEVALAEGAQVTHTKLQQEGDNALHVGDVFAKLGANSSFESHSFSIGAKWARSDTRVFLESPGANCLMNGIYLPRDAQHIDHHTTVEHLVPGCTSSQDYKGIISDKARAVFNGKVLVSEGAFQTEAKQYNKNVLLSKEAEVDTKPELQIFADDVICAHGATVGQLDEEALFYLASRGIDSELANRYLIQAFLADNLRLLKSLQIGDEMEQCLIQHMERT